ncbi:NrdH-redoxin [Candidatus Micrarchaeota archaeon RBG_16_36_9]|nr:MAG: NrdH-redoxin [Candidatus Micrarchaeota archaeon RBG_16_36_9]
MFMNVRVFSTKFCPYCKMAKDFLKEKKIPFEDINVQEDQNAAKEMIEKSGQVGVPVIEIDSQMVIGFDMNTIKKLLKLD